MFIDLILFRGQLNQLKFRKSIYLSQFHCFSFSHEFLKKGGEMTSQYCSTSFTFILRSWHLTELLRIRPDFIILQCTNYHKFLPMHLAPVQIFLQGNFVLCSQLWWGRCDIIKQTCVQYVEYLLILNM